MSSEPIVCRSTFWYHWRRIAMIVLVLGFCAYFIYDWKVGYPRKREAVAEWVKLRDAMGGKDAVEKEVDAAYAKCDASSWRWEAWTGWTAWRI